MSRSLSPLPHSIMLSTIPAPMSEDALKEYLEPLAALKTPEAALAWALTPEEDRE